MGWLYGISSYGVVSWVFFLLYKKDKTFKSWLEFYILLVLGLMLDYTQLTVVVELMVFVMVLCDLIVHKNQKKGK
jgi:hypothetical protein